MNIIFKQDCPYFESNCGGCETDKIDCSCPKLKAYIDVNNPEIKQRELDKLNITATSKFGKMLQMQKIFASKFHKTDNLSKSEIDKWTNDYLVCIEDEIMEAEEFLKIQNIKEFNLIEYRKELIDIIHFLMDGMVVAGITENDLAKILNENGDFLTKLVEKSKSNIEKLLNTTNNDIDLASTYVLNYMLRDIRLVRQCISWKHWKKPSNSINKDKLSQSWFGMLEHLTDSFVLADMGADDIYNIYINKNIENILRQSYNY